MDSKSFTPSVSIIVCTYARARMVERALRALEHLDGIDEAETIVVDNNSPDDTAQTVAQCSRDLAGAVHIRYVFEPRQGLSAARNAGIAASRAPIVAFLDDDAVPGDRWLRSIIDAFEQIPEAAAIGGIINPEFETARPEWLVKGLELPYGIVNLGDAIKPYGSRMHPFGGNCAIRRSVFDQLQFPEWLGRKGSQSLLSGEETWLFKQMRSRGLKLYYVPDMMIEHYTPAARLNPEWIKKRFYYQGISNALEARGAAASIRTALLIILKRLYIAAASLRADTAGKRLLIECRKESIRGSIEALRNARKFLSEEGVPS